MERAIAASMAGGRDLAEVRKSLAAVAEPGG